MTNSLTHLDDKGQAHMVDISTKDSSLRTARAAAYVEMQAETLAIIVSEEVPKGDVFATARIAAIQACKKTSDLIPLCHPLMLTKVNVEINPVSATQLEIICECALSGKTGVEMEALTGATVAALTIYDMCKALDKGIVIKDISLLSKTGGKSGDWSKTRV